jgi:60 kDa SS-A/Ro ribonucleoprotein
MTNYTKTLASIVNTKVTLQTQVIPGREADMTSNSAGGVSFILNEWDQLDRFLILGTEGPTYYASEQDLTKQNYKVVAGLVARDGIRVVNRVVEISDSGRAPKNDPALFVLALASAADNQATRKAALAALPRVARIGTHLFHYVAFVENFRGWGRALKSAVANWYLEMPIDRLANQAIKYQSRDGWSHRDLLRLSHPSTNDMDRDAILRWMVGGQEGVASSTRIVRAKDGTSSQVSRPDLTSHLHVQIQGFEHAKAATTPAEIIKLITDYDLPREAIPTQFLTDPRVWEALLVKMPMTAMIRNLATMTRNGLLTSMSDAERTIKSRLDDGEILRKSRVHPIAILAAMLTYQSGHSARGSSTWTPIRGVIDALDGAFYKSFGNVTPTGKNTLLALDVSGSMGGGEIAGIPGLNPRIASAAMALITANVEDNYEVIGFTGGVGRSYGWGGTTNSNVTASGPVSILKISPRQRLDDVLATISGLPFGTTDCSLPMQWAETNLPVVDSFAVYTDNESYHGSIHPSQALNSYRAKTGRAGKLAVVGMTSTGFTIADPKDSGMIDLVGFDSAAPQLMSDFFSN